MKPPTHTLNYWLLKNLDISNSDLFKIFGLLSFVSIGHLSYPWLLKIMADRYSVDFYVGVSINVLIASMIILFFLSSVCTHYSEKQLFLWGNTLRNSIRIQLYHTLLNNSVNFIRQQKIGELSARCSEDLSRIQLIIPDIIAPLYRNVLFGSGCIVFMITLNVKATLTVISFSVFILPLLFFLAKRNQLFAAKTQDDHAEANALFEETLVGLREVKAFVREDFELKRFQNYQFKAHTHETHSFNYTALFNQIIYLCVTGLLLSVFYFTYHGTLFSSTGESIAFYMYSYTLAMSVLSSAKLFFNFKKIAAPIERIKRLIDDVPQKITSNKIEKELLGAIQFENVNFGYNNRPIIKNLSANIDIGDCLIIKGPSGSGKSTIANLLMGFYYPQEGAIIFDDVSLLNWDLSRLRAQIGYVGQDPYLFRGTLRDNICFAIKPVSKLRLEETIFNCCLEEMISQMPEGLETGINERGLNLSGGQRARIAIARAILHDPPVLILDEANSMLEDGLESRLWKNIFIDRKQKTTIVISHHTECISSFKNTKLIDLNVSVTV
ncbi:ABC transporter ATP-binding protein/permease [bacterium]|nr:ABC transporter ATP-binding protein/permease [bacterium]